MLLNDFTKNAKYSLQNIYRDIQEFKRMCIFSDLNIDLQVYDDINSLLDISDNIYYNIKKTKNIDILNNKSEE